MRKIIPLAFLLAIEIVLRAFPQTAASGIIYIVESYNHEYAWDAGYRESLIERLGSTYRLEWFEMDTKRLPSSEFQKAADAAWKRYKALSPSLVILCDDAALKFLGPRLFEGENPRRFSGNKR